MTTPIERLREQHRPCSVPCFTHSWVGDRAHCAKCSLPDRAYTWPCDTIAALDALEVEGRDIQFRMFELQTRLDAAEKEILDLLALRPTRGQLVQRLDAATVLIRQAMEERHYSIRPNTGDSETRCGSPLGTSIDTCPNCRPYREWLAGDKEEHSE